jgi:penicillin amidase
VLRPSDAWFDEPVDAARDAALSQALTQVVAASADRAGAPGPVPWGRLNEVLFAHPLALGEQGRRIFNVGPFPMPGYRDTLLAVAGGEGADVGPSFRIVADLADWDRTQVTNAPGQSGWPGSPHYRDLADGWAAGEYFALPFSEAAVEASAAATLVLVPRP